MPLNIGNPLNTRGQNSVPLYFLNTFIYKQLQSYRGFILAFFLSFGYDNYHDEKILLRKMVTFHIQQTANPLTRNSKLYGFMLAKN
jgi:hypothetical protein